MGDLLLIRHGQASFGAADYDRLSPVGEQQSLSLGAWLAAHEAPPAHVVRGALRRHAQTAEHCLRAAGLDAPVEVVSALDELDHVELLARHRPDLDGHEALAAELRAAADPHRAFQQMFVAAVDRWTAGAHDHEYLRPWPQFRRGVLEALTALAARARDSEGDTWVVTSGGPIAVIAAHLFGTPPERSFALSWPLANTGLSRVRVNGSGPQMVTYNAWPHLAGDTALLTYR
ncbi:histidine phosphatase family protein [Dyella ginsengisoli]|uniref:Histidine phosphatase family protein n=1 Tax=Dyella ginsengisoli TaxID=363848 RepID=A0ABW8JZ69_9GAMM